MPVRVSITYPATADPFAVIREFCEAEIQRIETQLDARFPHKASGGGSRQRALDRAELHGRIAAYRRLLTTEFLPR